MTDIPLPSNTVYSPICRMCGSVGYQSYYVSQTDAQKVIEEHIQSVHPWYWEEIVRGRILEKIAEAAFNYTSLYQSQNGEPTVSSVLYLNRILHLKKELDNGD